MAADHNDPLKTRILQGFHPLVRVQARWMEYVWILPAVSPFHTGKRIHAEVDERGKLFLMVLQLRFRGDGPQASGGATSSAGAADTGNANGCKASIVATKSASHFFTFLTLSHSFLLNV